MNTMVGKLFLLIIISLVAFEAGARDLCKIHDLGWHFYCDPKKEQPDKETKVQATPAQAREELKALQDKLEDLRIMSVMYPSHENVKNYIAFQQEQLERSAKFAVSWRDVLRNTPELDYMVKTPNSTIGNSLLQEHRHKDQLKVLGRINERYGLFFFYAASCAYCQKFSPILKVFADNYGVSVMAISINGEVLPEWPNSEVNQGQAAKFGLEGKPVPATILFDNETGRLITVGYGLLTVSELEERIYELTRE